jgi:hypothetical protein
MGIYEETYEKIAYRVKQGDEKKNKTTLIPEGVDDDDALVRQVELRKRLSTMSLKETTLDFLNPRVRKLLLPMYFRKIKTKGKKKSQ